jgi:hypothetical protein
MGDGEVDLNQRSVRVHHRFLVGAIPDAEYANFFIFELDSVVSWVEFYRVVSCRLHC